MNKKLKITLNLTVFVLEAVRSYLQEKRLMALEARVAELELRSNTTDKVIAVLNRRAVDAEKAKGAP